MSDVRHKIGSTRTVRTAVMVVEYLSGALGHPHTSIHSDRIRYQFTEPSERNGFWLADIIVEAPTDWSLDESREFVACCRAFVAGAGEIWI
jgi:hypothetical protein